MREIIKFYKPYLLTVIAIVSLLAVRAQAELRLPDYMSNIVDTGISQKGIDSPVPKAIRESSFNILLALMDSGEADEVLKYYTLINVDSSDNENFVKDYPALANEPIYVLQVPENSSSDAIVDIMTDALLNLMEISPEGEQTSVDALRAMPRSVQVQAASEFVRFEYEALGVDMNGFQLSYILKTGGTMLLVLAVILAVIICETFLSSRMAAGVAKALRSSVFSKVTQFSNSEFDKFSIASLITRSTNDIQQIQMISFLFMRFIVFSPMLGIGAVIKVVETGSGMTWIIILAVLAVLTFVITIFSIVIPRFKLMQKLIDKLNLVARESLTGLMVIRAFNTEHYEESKFDKANTDIKKLSLFISRLFSVFDPVLMFIFNGVTLLIIWVGSGLVNDGNLQVGTMMAFLQYAMQIINSFMMLTMIAINLPRALVSVNRVSEVLTTKSSINDPEKAETNFDKKLKGIVEFKDVSFKYPDAGEYAVKNLSFIAKPGETTAFIGSTGSGKSAAINLIPRFYDVTEGQVLVEGVDVRNVKQKDLRRKIGYVPQKGLLFTGTIESNIKFGKTAGLDIDDDDMVKAAQIAQAENFIQEKTDKYQDPIAQAGANVSGGQKQRLSIARAVAKKPDIFIFDDSFSALDYKTDAALRRAIGENLGDATIIIVAQRVGTIKNAHQIIVLEDGETVGKGTHKELLKNCEVYRQIALSQLSEKELELETSGKEALK